MADIREPVDTMESELTGMRWYQGISRYAWIVFVICSLGWMFDAMDQNLFSLVRQPSVTELLKEAHVAPAILDAEAKRVAGNLTSIFLVGWACGGFIFGVVGDRLGRTRTMMITICIYALFTGLNGFVHSIPAYATCRFLTALGVGGEFAAGAALVAEVWPERSRPMALGSLQALSALGNIAASLIVITFAHVSWRNVFFIGAAPALLVVWVASSVREPEKWQQARLAAMEGTGKQLGGITVLFSTPELRRNTLAGFLLAVAGISATWGVTFFLPDLVGSALKPAIKALPEITRLPAAAQPGEIAALLTRYRALQFMELQIGAGLGMFAFAALSERIGRKPSIGIFLVIAFVMVQVTFWRLNSFSSAFLLSFPLGFGAQALFAAYAVYFPELYPTRLRASGVGFCYNAARIVAALAPFALGHLAVRFASPTDEAAGLRHAASIVACVYVVGLVGLIFAPETKGKPLPA